MRIGSIIRPLCRLSPTREGRGIFHGFACIAIAAAKMKPERTARRQSWRRKAAFRAVDAIAQITSCHMLDGLPSRFYSVLRFMVLALHVESNFLEDGITEHETVRSRQVENPYDGIGKLDL